MTRWFAACLCAVCARFGPSLPSFSCLQHSSRLTSALSRLPSRCSVPNIVDYALPSVRQLLADSSPYVRRTAVIGVAKLYRVAAAKIKGLFCCACVLCVCRARLQYSELT
jgi:hypothetical protein